VRGSWRRAGTAAAHLPGGTLDTLRNIAGIGLLSAAVIGGALSWIGPTAYLVLSEFAIMNAWRTPWTWATRPPNDLGAAICAALIFGAGLGLIAIRGARDSGRE
jgi:hypothetical protein